jgi:hypothetical protein
MNDQSLDFNPSRFVEQLDFALVFNPRLRTEKEYQGMTMIVLNDNMLIIVIAVIVTILIILQVMMIQMAGIMVAVVLYQLIRLNKFIVMTAIAIPKHCHNAMRNVQIIISMMMPKALPIMILMTRIMKMAPFPPLPLPKNVVQLVQPIFLYPRHKKISSP